jgi:hypothetical protein
MNVVKKENPEKSLCQTLTRKIKKRILVQAIFGHIFDEDFYTIPSSSEYMVDIFFTRFPEIGKQIFELLDNESLQKCRESSRHWNEFLDLYKMPWVNVIQKVAKYSNKDCSLSPKKWEKMFRKTEVEDVKHFAITLQKEKLKSNQADLFKKKSLLHLAAMFKTVPLIVFKNLYKAEENRSPLDLHGDTPLHVAARNGNFDVFKWLFTRPDQDGNAFNFRMNTPLHLAAASGHLKICKFMVEEMKRGPKNPLNWPLFRNFDDETPLTLAKKNEHKAIVKLFYGEKDAWIIYIFCKTRPSKKDG